MRRKSYSKTLSLRTLTVLLVLVLLGSVMPVLPVGANENPAPYMSQPEATQKQETNAVAMAGDNFTLVFEYGENYVLDENDYALNDYADSEELKSADWGGGRTFTYSDATLDHESGKATFTVTKYPSAGLKFYASDADNQDVNVSYYLNEDSQNTKALSMNSRTGTYAVSKSVIGDANKVTILVRKNPVVTVKGYTTTSNFSIATQGFKRGNNADDVNYTATVEPGTEFVFVARANSGFNAPAVTYNAGEQSGSITPNSANEYSLVINQDTEITIADGAKMQYALFFASNAGFKIMLEKNGNYNEPAVSGQKSFDYGTNVKFKVVPEDGYQFGSSVVVSANSKPLSSSGDYVYEIVGISEDTTLTVNGITVQTFRVSFPSDAANGYTVSPNSETVEWKGTAIFTVTVATGYKYDEKEIVLGGDEVTKRGSSSSGDNVYSVRKVNNSTFEITVESVTKALNLSITGGVTVITYTVSADAGTGKGYAVKFQDDSGTVNHGGTVSFTVAPEEGYYIGSVYLLLNGRDETGGTRVLSPSGGSYTIENVTRDYKVVVEAKLISVTVTFQLQSSATLNGHAGSQQVTYTKDNNSNDAFEKNVAGFYTLDLTKLEPTRKGWKFTRWNSSDGATANSVVVYNGQTASITVSPVWSVDTSKDPQNAFFHFTVTGTHDGGRDMVSVVVNSNVRKPDEDVVVSTYGIVYGVNDAFETYRSSLTTATFSSGTYNGWNSIGTGIGYWLFDGENAGTDAYDGGNFSFKSKHVNSGSCGRSAMAFIVVRIGNETCLFLSEVKPIALSGVGG